MKKLITLLVLMVTTVSLHAFEVTIGQLKYDINVPTQSATVVIPKVGYFDNYINGHLTIPSEIIYNGEKFAVTGIGENAFYGNYGMTSVDIPNSVISIGPNAFGGTSLSTVFIPSSVTSLSCWTFARCPNLTSIMVDENNPAYSSIDGVLYSDSNTHLLTYPQGLDGEFQIPEGVKYIDDVAFYECSKLTSVKLPKTVLTIRREAFNGCTGLNSIEFPTSLQYIHEFAFVNTSIKEVKSLAYNPSGISPNAFDEEYISATLYIPQGSKNNYANAEGWKYFRKVVDNLPVYPESLAFSAAEVSIEQDEEKQLEAILLPKETTFPLTYSSSDNNIATISETGVVKGVSVGRATITVTCDSYSATCEVEVLPISVKGVELNATNVSLYSTEDFQLTATINPDNAADKTVTWTSSDETVATVSGTGLVKALKGGVATISAKSGEITSSCVVVVTPMQITINQSNVSIEAEETVQLSATLVPEAYADEIEWATSDEKIATVTEEGVVTAVSVGNAVITASCRNVSATCDVEVLPISVKEITLDATTVSMYSPEEYQLTATVKPDNAADKTLIWKSSDESVATVSETGLISAHSVGSAIITAQNGNVTGSCVVVVLPKHVTLDEKEITLEIGSTKQLTAIVLPENVVNKTITWESTNPAVAEVSENGEVTALTSGVAVITATCGEGSAFCVVTVPEVEDATTMTLSIKLGVSKTLQLAAIISPDDAAAEVIWTSSNPEVADVSKDGLVSARTTGVAVITATYGENTVNCIFDVDNDSGVNEIMSTENGEVSVYNLQGIKMNVSTREEFNKLSPGYYIVNNQVELIK